MNGETDWNSCPLQRIRQSANAQRARSRRKLHEIAKIHASQRTRLEGGALSGFRLADDLEVGAAAVIHPDTAAVVAPAVALAAGRVAALLQQPHSASRVSACSSDGACRRRSRRRPGLRLPGSRSDPSRDHDHDHDHDLGPSRRGRPRPRNQPGNHDRPRRPCRPSPNCSLPGRETRCAAAPVEFGLRNQRRSNAGGRRRRSRKWCRCCPERALGTGRNRR